MNSENVIDLYKQGYSIDYIVNEYYLGRTNPKLSPINDPRLKVIIDEEEVDPKQQVSNRITKLFGDDPCIEIKK